MMTNAAVQMQKLSLWVHHIKWAVSKINSGSTHTECWPQKWRWLYTWKAVLDESFSVCLLLHKMAQTSPCAARNLSTAWQVALHNNGAGRWCQSAAFSTYNKSLHVLLKMMSTVTSTVATQAVHYLRCTTVSTWHHHCCCWRKMHQRVAQRAS